MDGIHPEIRRLQSNYLNSSVRNLMSQLLNHSRADMLRAKQAKFIVVFIVVQLTTKATEQQTMGKPSIMSATNHKTPHCCRA